VDLYAVLFGVAAMDDVLFGDVYMYTSILGC
jgi:hypothetical protein